VIQNQTLNAALKRRSATMDLVARHFRRNWRVTDSHLLKRH